MRLFINVLQVVHITSLIATAVFCLFGLYEQFVSPAAALDLLKKLHIHLKLYQVLIIGSLCIMITIGTHILIKKLQGEE